MEASFTEHGPLSSADAAIIILLPIVAAAIGMMEFGTELQIRLLCALGQKVSNGPNNSGNRAKRVVMSDLHPRVYAALIGLSLWFVVWVWSFFCAGVTGYLLFIVSGFIGVVIALWLILSSVRRPTEIVSRILTSRRHSATGCAETSTFSLLCGCPC